MVVSPRNARQNRHRRFSYCIQDQGLGIVSALIVGFNAFLNSKIKICVKMEVDHGMLVLDQNMFRFHLSEFTGSHNLYGSLHLL